MNAYEAPPVVLGEILERINRFVVKATLHDEENTIILSHLNNTGRLEQYLISGKKAWFYPLDNPKKTTHRLFAVEDHENKGAIIDTTYQMMIFERLVEEQRVSFLRQYRVVRRNARIGSSLIDYLLQSRAKDEDNLLYVEIKSAVYREDGFAQYPDCPSIRGHKHVQELTELARNGINSMILFIAALPEVVAFRPHVRADPTMGELLKVAKKSGVELKSISFHFNPQKNRIVIDNLDLPVVL